MKFLFFAFVFCLSNGFTQDLKKDILEMNLELKRLGEYKITVEYSVGDSVEFIDQGTASVLMAVDGLFYKTEFAEMIINPANTIIVNEEERTVIYSDNKSEPKNKLSVEDILLNGMDSLIESSDSIYFTQAGLNDKTYYIRFSNKYYDLIELTFNGNFLSKVIYYYNETFAGDAGLIATNDISFDFEPNFNNQLFSTNYYLKNENGTIKPTEEFLGYVLIYNQSIESFIK